MTPQTAEEMVDALTRSIAREKRQASPRRIGSTDCGPVAALYDPSLRSLFPKSERTAGDVWLRLCHNIEMPRSGRMARGIEKEPAVLQAIADAGLSVWRPHLAPNVWWTVRHPQHEFATCSPDAFDAPKPSRLIEIKTQSLWAKGWGKPLTDEIPHKYLFQVLWAAGCCDVEEVWVFAAFGSDNKATGQFHFTQTVPYVVRRSRELEARFFEYGAEFWRDFVATGRPPPVMSRHNRRAFKRLSKGWYGQ